MDNSIALQVQTPDSFKTIGSVLDMARGVQGLQGQRQQIEAGGLELQKQRQANQERVLTQQFMSDPNNWRTNGRIDIDKVNKLPQIAPLTGAQTVQKLTELGTAQTNAESAKQQFTGTQRSVLGSLYGVLGRAGAPKDAVVSELTNLKQQYAGNKPMQDYVDNALVGLQAMPDGPALHKTLITQAQSLLSPESQESLNPKAGLTNTGGSLQETITQPAVGGNAPAVSMTGRGQPLTLGPDSRESLVTGPDGNLYAVTKDASGKIIGSRPAPASGAAPAPAAAGTPGVTGAGGIPHVAPGDIQAQQTNKVGQAQFVNDDFAKTAEAAKTAQQSVGIMQNVKRYADTAFTGVGADRKSFVESLAAAIGIPTDQIGKTDTDLLIKNSNMAAIGGNTDAARLLLESANPNVHMTPEAIKHAADQVIAQLNMPLVKQKYLNQFRNDPQKYQDELVKFNSVADPRIWQLPFMNLQEKQKMKSAMSTEERKVFGDKIRQAEGMGIVAPVR